MHPLLFRCYNLFRSGGFAVFSDASIRGCPEQAAINRIVKRRENKNMDSFNELFQMVKEYTRQFVVDSKELSEIAYQVWIKSLEPVSFDGNTAVLYIKAEFMKKIVEEKYLGLLTKAFEQVVGFPVKVEILCDTPDKSEKKEFSPASVQKPLS